MAGGTATSDPSTWDPEFDAVAAAPEHHKVIFEYEKLRVLEVTLEPRGTCWERCGDTPAVVTARRVA